MAAWTHQIGKGVIFIAVVSVSAFLAACGGQKAETKPETSQAQTQSSQPAPAVEKETPLARAYKVILIGDVETTPQIATDYPDAGRECRTSLLSALREKKSFKRVGEARGKTAGALLVKAKITDMRIVSGAARFWGGAWAGSSFINADLQLIDGSNRKVVRQKRIESANNAWAAAWTGGSSDRNLPSDMGAMIAEYIASIMPAK